MAEAVQKNNRSSDVLTALSIVLMLAMILFPVPLFVIDMLVAFNMTISFIILLVTLYIEEPVQFSIFPSFLVVMTMFRVSLGIMITRAILINASAGKMIEAFGGLVVGGNYVVGIVIFTVLIVVQFIVITSGAQRVAEVAARFTLDAMPGKQMSIDADLNAGIITETEARTKRESISKEADFYGAMDGSTKFIRGDAIAAIVIIIVNIIAGFVVGVVQLEMTLLGALAKYVLLTIGAGIALQVPSLLVSASTGIVVTRSASSNNLGKDIVSQVFASSSVVTIAAAISFSMVFIPGIPKIPFILLSALIGFAAYNMSQNKKETVKKQKEEELSTAKKPQQGSPESVMPLLHFDPLELEIGYALIPLVDPEQGGDLLESITSIRKQTAMELGIIVPPIRIRDNMNISPNQYLIKMQGIEVASGELMVGRYLAMNPGTAKEKIQGYDTVEPTFNLPATWISEKEKNRAIALGYTVVDSSAVVTTHITETIKGNASELIGRQEVQALIDNIKENYPTVVEELIPKLLTIGEVQKVLQKLLQERISIRSLLIVLETLADYAPKVKEPDVLTEYVRQAMSKQISKQFSDESKVVQTITLDPEIEQNIADSIQFTDQGAITSLAPEYLQKLFTKVSDETKKMISSGYQPIVITSSVIRPHFKKMISKTLPNVNVLAYNEIVSELEIRSIGMVEMK
jgi:flagellar biosynthesis protein FlhA